MHFSCPIEAALDPAEFYLGQTCSKAQQGPWKNDVDTLGRFHTVTTPGCSYI